MLERERVVDTLKAELRKRGLTYQDLEPVLELSHASIKRLFAERNFTLDRLETICRFLGLDMAELFHLTEKKQQRLLQLTIEQEQQLAGDIRLLCLANALLNRWSIEEFLATFALAETEVVRLLAKLDRLKVIELLPGNRYKLLVSRHFQWLPKGPIQQFFEKQLQADFFDASFNQRDECRLFINTTLSRGAQDKALRLLARAADEINALHHAEEVLPLHQRSSFSVVLAARPWEARAFSALRRKQSPTRR